MSADHAYWAANVAGLDDPSLLRFIDACEIRRARYDVALRAAMTEAALRRLLPSMETKKDGAEAPPRVGRGRETTNGNRNGHK